MQTLVALGDILVKAIPTFILVWILFLYVTRVFLNPLQSTLRKRYEATEGLRKTASERISNAEQKTTAYQEALQVNAAEIYRQQEQDRQRAMEQRAEILKQAREKAGARIATARQEILQDAEQAKQSLQTESEQMAQWIMRAVLEPAAAGPAPKAAS